MSDICRLSGRIIATGGGCVTREENYPLLHQNGVIFWRKRALDTLPTAGRPISQSTDLTELYTKRAPLYGRFADHIVDNTPAADDAAQQIIAALSLHT